MIKFRKVLFGVLGICLLAAMPLAQAQNAPGPDETSQKLHPGQRIQEIYSRLNLTDDQKKQLEANKQQHRTIMEGLRASMKIDREALRQELMQPQLDMAKVNEIHNHLKTLQSQMEDDRLSSILAVRAILTPDQYLKFVNMMRKHKQEHEQ